MEHVTETRWIVLTTDGRHSSVGRHTDPTPEQIADVEAQLRASGLSGWLVLMKGAYYAGRRPGLMMVRPLGEPPREGWEGAKEAFEATRLAALSPT